MKEEKVMAFGLTDERRNEIAFEYVLRRIAEKPLQDIQDYSSFVRKLMPSWSKQDVQSYTNNMLYIVALRKSGLKDFDLLSGDLDTLKAMSWPFLLAFKFSEGIKIGELTKREIGNEAKMLGISYLEAFKFACIVATHVFEEVFIDASIEAVN